MPTSFFFGLVLMTLAMMPSFTVFSQKQELDEDAYHSWRRVDDYHLSPNGRWVIYRYAFYHDQNRTDSIAHTYYLYNCDTEKTHTLVNIDSPEFFGGGEWISYTPTDTLMSCKITVCLHTMQSCSHPEEAELNPEYPFISYKTHDQNLVIKNLKTNDSICLEHVDRYRIYDKHRKIIYTRQVAQHIEIGYGPVNQLRAHQTLYRDTTGSLKHFLFNRYDKTGLFQINGSNGKPDYYQFSLTDKQVKCILSNQKIADFGADISSVDVISDRFIRYSRTNPRMPRQEKGKKDESFELELWSWNDEIIPTQQEISGYYPKRTPEAEFIYNRETETSYPLPTGKGGSLQISPASNPLYAFQTDESPYARFHDWQHDTRYDLYSVNLQNGIKQLVAKALTRTVRWSPDGKQILFFDNNTMSWALHTPERQATRYLKDEIPFPLYDERYDRPNPAPPYGIGGWSNDGRMLLVYDRFDIWLVDLQNDMLTRCYTKGYGRLQQTRLRMIDPGQNEPSFDTDKPLYVTTWNEVNKKSGIYKLMPNGRLTRQIEGDFDLTISEQSKDLQVSLCMKQSYIADRDLWVSSKSHTIFKKITDVNPQQCKYKWGNVKQVEWINYEGNKNLGLLYLPDDYDSTRRYPAIVTFYETHTPEMHIHPVPGLSQALIDIPTYVSKGYVVFQPDVYFKTGTPGQSSYNAVVSGTQALIDRGIIDEQNIGLQGHSWSGFQVAYLVTRTNLFKCVNIGAALTNFTSAYTAIREESGIPCMLMYEDWQCRMGTSLWENLPAYIENSPIFAADKIHTPALIFHCDHDGAVTQDDGRNLFLALRRLQRPAWLLNYKGEGHSLTSQPAMLDWTIRMEQFFNHYLKGTPLPRWMKEGINIHERGFDQKYDLLKE